MVLKLIFIYLEEFIQGKGISEKFQTLVNLLKTYFCFSATELSLPLSREPFQSTSLENKVNYISWTDGKENSIGDFRIFFHVSRRVGFRAKLLIKLPIEYFFRFFSATITAVFLKFDNSMAKVLF